MKQEETHTNCKGFQWDAGNVAKNEQKHGVTPAKAEQIFFRQPLIVLDSEWTHPREKRFYALGQTDAGKRLFVAFTIRSHLIRVISARPMSRKERMAYEKQEKADS